MSFRRRRRRNLLNQQISPSADWRIEMTQECDFINTLNMSDLLKSVIDTTYSPFPGKKNNPGSFHYRGFIIGRTQ